MPDAHAKLGRQLEELGAVIDRSTDRYAQRIAELESKLTALEKQIEVDRTTITELDAELERALKALDLERGQLRDKFAMAALTRIGLGGASWVAVQAYEIADAMLDIRKTPLPRTTDGDGGIE
jgi:DNA repair ATPase RecN